MLLGGGCGGSNDRVCANAPRSGEEAVGVADSWGVNVPSGWSLTELPGGNQYLRTYRVAPPGGSGEDVSALTLVVRPRGGLSVREHYAAVLSAPRSRELTMGGRPVLSYWSEGELTGWSYVVESSDWILELVDLAESPDAAPITTQILSTFGDDCDQGG